MCGPSARFVNAFGDLHAANAAPSRRHSKLAPPSLAENAKLGFGSFVVPAGPEVMEVSGAATSVVMSSDQPPAIWPVSPAVSSSTHSFQVPFGSMPRNGVVRQPPAERIGHPGPGCSRSSGRSRSRAS